MKYRVTTSADHGLYSATIETFDFSQHEVELMSSLGEPTVALGGDFEATITRNGQTDTAIVTSVNNSATLVPVIDANGTITAITVTAGGSYGSTPVLSATGVGTGFAATAVRTSTAITSVTVENGGYGWQKTPVDVDYSLPARSAGLKTGFPVKQSFDLADHADADARMKAWYEEVVSRITTARTQLLAREVTFKGEIVATL